MSSDWISAPATGSILGGRDRPLYCYSVADPNERRRKTSYRRKLIGRSTWMPRVEISTESYRENLLRSLKDPKEAAEYLNASLEDQDPRVFLLALRDVADAHGGVGAVSRTARLNRESLYRMLSKTGNPSLESLAAVLGACGLRLAVESAKPARGKRRIA